MLYTIVINEEDGHHYNSRFLALLEGAAGLDIAVIYERFHTEVIDEPLRAEVSARCGNEPEGDPNGHTRYSWRSNKDNVTLQVRAEQFRQLQIRYPGVNYPDMFVSYLKVEYGMKYVEVHTHTDLF